MAWFNSDPTFTKYFTINDSTAGALAAADLVTYADMELFAGGTETYSTTALDTILAAVDELDCSFILSDKSDATAGGTENTSILAHIVNDASFKKHLVVGLGDNQTDFEAASTGSKAVAEAFGSQYVIGCHGGDQIPYVLNNQLLQN